MMRTKKKKKKKMEMVETTFNERRLGAIGRRE
jgi:hypothetical protein